MAYNIKDGKPVIIQHIKDKTWRMKASPCMPAEQIYIFFSTDVHNSLVHHDQYN